MVGCAHTRLINRNKTLLLYPIGIKNTKCFP